MFWRSISCLWSVLWSLLCFESINTCVVKFCILIFTFLQFCRLVSSTQLTSTSTSKSTHGPSTSMSTQLSNTSTRGSSTSNYDEYSCLSLKTQVDWVCSSPTGLKCPCFVTQNVLYEFKKSTISRIHSKGVVEFLYKISIQIIKVFSPCNQWCMRLHVAAKCLWQGRIKASSKSPQIANWSQNYESYEYC